MTDPLFDPGDDAATPLEPEEREQLIPTYITTRARSACSKSLCRPGEI